jgi:hypothetical protein
MEKGGNSAAFLHGRMRIESPVSCQKNPIFCGNFYVNSGAFPLFLKEL